MDEYEERWRPVKDFMGLYEVSNLGRVRSISRVVAIGNGKRLAEGRVLRPNMKNGYPTVSLHDGDRQSYVLVHRLVAMAFVPGTGEVVRHLDGQPGNASAENLAWGTFADNEADKRRHGRVVEGERHHNARATEQDIRDIRAMHARGMTQLEIARQLGLGRGTVGTVVRGEGWRHVV